ncbi:hypothetical protein VYU27_008551 [Nannochloropsis oceanica]
MSSIPSFPFVSSLPNVNVASGLNAGAAGGSGGDGEGDGGGDALEEMVAPSLGNLSLSSPDASANVAAVGEEVTNRARAASSGCSGGCLNSSSSSSKSSGRNSSSSSSSSGKKTRRKRDFAMKTPALVSPTLDATSLGEWVRLDRDSDDEDEDEKQEEQGEGVLEEEDEEGHGEEAEEEEEEEEDSGEEGEAGVNNHPSGAGTSLPPPPHTHAIVPRRPRTNRHRNRNRYKPCQRSLHVAAVLEDKLIVFGGYQGTERVADCYLYDFLRRRWSVVVPAPGGHPPPSPRDRHVGVVYKRTFYIFGGFDGSQRVNDFMGFSLDTREWRSVVCLMGSAPTPRHSHTGVVYKDKFYVLTGYDGSYRNDFHAFSFLQSAWAPVPCAGKIPRPRYRATSCVKVGGEGGTEGGTEGRGSRGVHGIT